MQTSRLLLLFPLISTVFLPPAPSSAEALQVGDISQLDLARMARILPQDDAAAVAAVTRPLSLDDALQLALEKNLRIQIATADVDTFRPEVDAQRAFFHPSVGADGVVAESSERLRGVTETLKTHDARGFLRQEVPTGGTIAVGGEWLNENPNNDFRSELGGAFVEVRQPLLRGGRVYVSRRFISDAEFDLEIQQARLGAEVLDVAAQTKVAYYNTVLSARLIQVIEAAIVRDMQLIEASRALFDAGRVTKRDVVSAEIQLSKSRIDLASREGEREVAQDQLRDLLGTPIGIDFEVTDREIPFRPIELRLEEWIRTALDRRPELLEIRRRLEKAELDTRVRENDLLPVLDVVGAGRQDLRSGHSRNYDWQVGGVFEYPLGNVAAERRLQAARAFEIRTRREYEQTERAIELEVRQIEISLRESTRRLRDLIRGLEQARAKREIAQARFELGQADNFDITDADDDLVAAESDLLRAVVDYASNLALLEARIAAPI
jgi:outer membrane protein TolC